MSKKKKCPLFKAPCIEHECEWFAHIEGRHPQTGATMDHWACAIPWIPIMIVDGTRQMRGVQAAVESFRNESMERQDALNTTLVATQILPAINGMKDLPKLEE